MYSPRALTTRRVPELLSDLKTEFDSLVRDADMFKLQKEEYERKRKLPRWSFAGLISSQFKAMLLNFKTYRHEYMNLKKLIPN